MTEQRDILKELGRGEGYNDRYPDCGLGQAKVPCEAMIPHRISTKHRMK